jgi:hypothetical protein
VQGGITGQCSDGQDRTAAGIDYLGGVQAGSSSMAAQLTTTPCKPSSVLAKPKSVV